MSEKQFLRAWYTGIYIAAGVVAAVAALLLAIIGTARVILHNARRILELANEIVANTRPIWDLEQTNEVAAQISEAAQAITGHAAETADALGETHAS
jgi:hypothetical protein